MSKWVETAMRPVPERSHMLKTWPTKAGPPTLPFELSLATRTDFAAGRADSAAGASTVFAAEVRGGGRKRGREIAEGSCGCVRDEGGGFWCGLKREAKVEAVDWRKEEMWLWLLLRRR